MTTVEVGTMVGQRSQVAPELPLVECPDRLAPRDARELSRLFFEQLAVLEEGTPPISTRATP